MVKTLNRYRKDWIKEESAKEMFEKLRQHIGEKVTYNGWWYGVWQNETAELKLVEDYELVEIGGIGFPFVGFGCAVTSILSKDGELLYFNFDIEDNYDRRTSSEVFESMRFIFGDRIVDKKQLKHETYLAETAKHLEKINNQSKINKAIFMKEGLTLIKPELALEWLECVNANTDEGYSAIIVEASILMMKNINEGVSFEEAENKVCDDKLGLTGYQVGATASVVSHFSIKGEEYRKHWNAENGLTDESIKGTVNPAILTLKK